MTPKNYLRGTIVLVPFPFTDLSSRKKRPALIVSPDDFHEEDLILCAVTSRVPERLSEWEVSLGARDMVEGYLPKTSIVKVGKLFTMHRSLVAGGFGSVKGEKLGEVLAALTKLFANRTEFGEGDGVTR